MKKIDWRIVLTVIVTVAMTLVGVYLMEEEWMEIGSAIIWAIGEVLIVETLLVKDIMKDFYKMVEEVNE